MLHFNSSMANHLSGVIPSRPENPLPFWFWSLCLLFLSLHASAQKQANIWHFGDGRCLDFSSHCQVRYGLGPVFIRLCLRFQHLPAQPLHRRERSPRNLSAFLRFRNPTTAAVKIDGAKHPNTSSLNFFS